MARKKKKLARYPSDFTAAELATVGKLISKASEAELEAETERLFMSGRQWGKTHGYNLNNYVGSFRVSAEVMRPDPPAGRGEIIDITAETIEEEKALCIRNTAKTKQS